MTATQPELVEIRLIGVPLAIVRRAIEHHEALRREFALISHDEDADVPRRLLRLSHELEERFSRFTQDSAAEQEAAIAAGLERFDRTLLLPREVREATREFEALLEEADEYCRRGALLTLATPPEQVRYRRWLFSQIADQVSGMPPVPWDEWVQRNPDPS